MKYVLILIAILFSNQAVALNCEKQPTCEELNYSKEDDPQCAEDGYILCPFDFSYKKCAQPDCEKLGFTSSEKSGWCSEIITCPQDLTYTACNCLKPRCNIGDVFYADGSCGEVKDYSEDKIAVGVVYDTNCAGGGKVINLHDLGRESENKPFDPTNPYDIRYRYLYWGYEGYNVPKLVDYNSDEYMLTPLKNRDPSLYDGKGNTDKILAAAKPKCNYEENTKEYYQYCIPQAAQAAHEFYPPKVDKLNSVIGQGRWYLPSLGELMDLYGCDNLQIISARGTSGMRGETKKLVNSTLSALKGKGVEAEMITDGNYLSSSEVGDQYIWRPSMSDGEREHGSKRYYQSVRVSLEF